MNALRKILKRSPAALRLISSVSYVSVWLLVRAEAFFSSLTDRLVRMTLRAHTSSPRSSLRLYRTLWDHHTPNRYTDQMAKDLAAHGLTMKSSFSAAVYLRFAHSKHSDLPEMKINPKSAGIRFARAGGLKVPEQYQAHVSFREIAPTPGSVIKPESEFSAHGVFIVRSLDEIMELNSGKVFSSWESFHQRIRLLLKEGVVHDDSWVVEELVLGHGGKLPNDVKFNVFYGMTGWVAEIERYPRFRCYMMRPDGTELVSKLYLKEETFIGQGATREEIKMVEEFSLQIPVPYMRIDFLRGADGLVFGEFTPRPGIIGYFDRERDRLYGRMFHEAEARLRNDLVSGKKFELFNNI